MNCKENDLAIIVRDTYRHGCDLIGATVQVETPLTLPVSGRQAWTLKGWVKCRACGNSFTAMYDADLQPIRGTPVGARDSMPIEKPEEVTA